MKYRILSPDNLPLCSDEPKVNTQAKVIDYIFGWARRYERQGYYLTAHREHIHWLELPYRVQIVRWGIKGKITEMKIDRVGYEATPRKLVDKDKQK